MWKIKLLVWRDSGAVEFHQRLGYADQARVTLGERLGGQVDR